jgi:hypothetical protein
MPTIRSSRYLVGLLVILLAACAGSPGASTAPAGGSAEPPESAGAPDSSSAPGSSQGPTPSEGGTAVGDDCEERRSAASEAATNIHLMWEGINYYVESDDAWAAETAPGGKVDVALYRTSLELIKDIPDPHEPSEFGEQWSATKDDAQRLADLLEQAAASGTPFADGIGEEIHSLASDLAANQFGMHAAVDDLCYDPADEVMAAGVEEMLAVLVPPSSTETDRTTSPTLSIFHFDSTDSIDDLASFYPTAIEETGYEATLAFDDRPSSMRWNMQHATKLFDWSVILYALSDGSGTEVSISFTGEP